MKDFGKGGMETSPRYMKRHRKNTEVLLKCKVANTDQKKVPVSGCMGMIFGCLPGLWALTPCEPSSQRGVLLRGQGTGVFSCFLKRN